MVDELLTWTKLRDQWQNFEDLFRAAWFDPTSKAIYYLKNPGGLIFGQARPNAYGVIDPPRTVFGINNFNVYEIRNPTGSGVRIMLTSVTVSHSAARQFRIIPAVQLTDQTNVLASGPKAPEMPAAKAVVSNANNGTTFSVGNWNASAFIHVELLQANVARDYVQPGIEVSPGNTVQFTVGDTTDAAGESSTFSAEWIEY